MYGNLNLTGHVLFHLFVKTPVKEVKPAQVAGETDFIG